MSEKLVVFVLSTYFVFYFLSLVKFIYSFLEPNCLPDTFLRRERIAFFNIFLPLLILISTLVYVRREDIQNKIRIHILNWLCICLTLISGIIFFFLSKKPNNKLCKSQYSLSQVKTIFWKKRGWFFENWGFTILILLIFGIGIIYFVLLTEGIK